MRQHRRQPTGLPHPWDSPGKNTGVGCHFLLQCMKVKVESEKVVVKLNIQKTKIMASGPISSWQIDGERVETVSDFIFFGLQNHWRWWLQPWNSKMLAPWKKSDDQPRQHIKKQRHYFPTKIHLVKSMVFPVVMYECESWTVKKAEHQRIDVFKLWC